MDATTGYSWLAVFLFLCSHENGHQNGQAINLHCYTVQRLRMGRMGMQTKKCEIPKKSGDLIWFHPCCRLTGPRADSSGNLKAHLESMATGIPEFCWNINGFLYRRWSMIYLVVFSTFLYMLYMLVYWVVGILARLVTGHEPPKKNGLLHFWRFVSWRSLDGGSEFYKE